MTFYSSVKLLPSNHYLLRYSWLGPHEPQFHIMYPLVQIGLCVFSLKTRSRSQWISLNMRADSGGFLSVLEETSAPSIHPPLPPSNTTPSGGVATSAQVSLQSVWSLYFLNNLELTVEKVQMEVEATSPPSGVTAVSPSITSMFQARNCSHTQPITPSSTSALFSPVFTFPFPYTRMCRHKISGQNRSPPTP